MECGGKVAGVKRALTSYDYIAGMLDGDVILISIYLMIIYKTNDYVFD